MRPATTIVDGKVTLCVAELDLIIANLFVACAALKSGDDGVATSVASVIDSAAANLIDLIGTRDDEAVSS